MNLDFHYREPAPSRRWKNRTDQNGKSSKKTAEIRNMKNSVVVFQDEVHFMAQTTVTRSWAPVGSAPKIKSLPGRDKISFSGFVVPKTGQLFMDKPDRFNYETVIASIRSFLCI